MAGEQRNWHGNRCQAWQSFLMAFGHGMVVAAVGMVTMETFGAGREQPLPWPG